MRVDGREIPVTGNLLQPMIRRTSDGRSSYVVATGRSIVWVMPTTLGIWKPGNYPASPTPSPGPASTSTDD